MSTSSQPLEASALDEASALVAALPLYRRYGLDAARTRRLLEGALDDDRAHVIVARDAQGQLVGLAWLVERGAFDRSAYLRLIAVAEAAQGQGVGRALLGQLETLAGPRGLALLVTADNHAARRFYERLGYRHVGTLASYVLDGVDEALYFKATC